MDKIQLLNQRISLLQPEDGFRTSQDAVLLAAACPAKEQETVLELGCGVGSAIFCLLWRQPHLNVTGIDIEQTYLDLAQQNAVLNDMTVTLTRQDIIEYAVTNPKDRFDHVICNPPFFDTKTHIPSPKEIKARAKGHQEHHHTLDAWIKSAFDALRPKGCFTIIHKAEKLDHILQLLTKRFGATEIIPIYSKQNEPAKRVIVRSYKERHSPCKLYPSVIMHKEGNTPSEISDKLLRDGQSFDKVFEE